MSAPKSARSDVFRRLAQTTAHLVGSSGSFLVACTVVFVWGLTGPLFHFSDTWQLVINTGTTIVTFLMVFLIQTSQNRDSIAVHLKLDELLRAVDGARTGLVNLESLSDAELLSLHHEFEKLQVKFGLEREEALTPQHVHRELASRSKSQLGQKKH